jgi:uncharacterized protein YciI
MASEEASAVTATKEFLYRIQATRPELVSVGPTPEEEGVLADHVTYLESLSEKGVVLLSGRTQNTDSSSFGIVIFRAEDQAHARRIMRDDPAVKNGIMRGELFPYRVAILGSAKGFGPDG